ncbi:MAG: ABC transporter substrate-binding protein, partial [Actinomycetota bacterium]
IKSTAKLKGTMPKLTYLGVPVVTGKADVSAEVAQILGFNPDIMIYSNQGSECWTWMNEMLKQGWTPKKFPVVLSGACIDLGTMAKLGDQIKGIYTLGGLSILDPDALSGFAKGQAVNYRDKMAKYSKEQKLNGTGFATQGYGVVMNTWMMMELAGGAKATGTDVLKAYKATKDHVGFGSTGLNCKDAIKPYIAVCSTEVSASMWNGKALKAVKGAQDFSGLVLVGKGDELRLQEVK